MAIRITVAGIVFQIRHYWEIRKVAINGHNLLVILICQTVALVRRALAEVCTVPLLLILYLRRDIPKIFSVGRVQIHNRFTTTNPNRSTAILGVWSTFTTLAISLLICENLNLSHCGFVCGSGPLNPVAGYLDPLTPWPTTCLLQR